MKRANEKGFIPLLVAILLVLIIGLILVYLRIQKAGH